MSLSAGQNLMLAWAARAQQAAEDVGRAELAPGLFRPEFVEERRREYARAEGQWMYWSAHSGEESGR